MPSVYCHPVIKQVVALHAELLSVYPGDLKAIDVLASQANTLLLQFLEKDEAVCVQLSNWLPECVGMDAASILKQELTIHHMQHAIAREYGYESWRAAESLGDVLLDTDFEHAVDAALNGNLKKLASLLQANPDLARAQSVFGHKATILVYMAANGVETWRQVVPENAVDVLELLVEAGADTQARIHVYGGLHSALELLLSSAHPRDAGVRDAMAEVLSKSVRKVK